MSAMNPALPIRIKSLYPAPGWRAVYPNASNTRIANVVFFALFEDAFGALPMVLDDHDFGTRLVSADILGHYALLGPDEEPNPEWLRELEALKTSTDPR